VTLPLHPRLARQVRPPLFVSVCYVFSLVVIATTCYFAVCEARAQERDLAPIVAALMDLTASAPNRTPIRRSERHRVELATAFTEAGDKYGIDPLLLVALAFSESSLRVGVVGAKGEQGLMQVMPSRAGRCDMATARGQVDCGAAELRKAIDLCGGDIGGGVARYASGRTCAWGEEREPGLFRVVSKRMKLWERLKVAK